jgi:hypothetical protein
MLKDKPLKDRPAQSQTAAVPDTVDDSEELPF